MKKVYFCGSIKGGRQLVSVYQNIVSLLKEQFEVLTEHIADAGYAASGFAPPHQVFIQDTSWLAQSDFVLAEVSVPSLGVGYELGYAESLGKRVYCLYDKELEGKVSSMIVGNKNFICIAYDALQLEKTVKNIMDTER